MSISLAALVDSIAGERIAELEAHVESLTQKNAKLYETGQKAIDEGRKLKAQVERLKEKLAIAESWIPVSCEALYVKEVREWKAKAEGGSSE